MTSAKVSANPVKLKKFRIDTKSHSEDILIGRDICVEECSATFDKIEMPTTLNLSNVKSLCVGQQVTLKAKVVSLHAPKHINQKPGFARSHTGGSTWLHKDGIMG